MNLGVEAQIQVCPTTTTCVPNAIGSFSYTKIGKNDFPASWRSCPPPFFSHCSEHTKNTDLLENRGRGQILIVHRWYLHTILLILQKQLLGTTSPTMCASIHKVHTPPHSVNKAWKHHFKLAIWSSLRKKNLLLENLSWSGHPETKNSGI